MRPKCDNLTQIKFDLRQALLKAIAGGRYKGVVMLGSEFNLVTKPNRALRANEQVRVFTVMAGFALLVALGFGLAGAWMVMPFAWLELTALAAALYYVNGSADDYEALQVSGDCLVVETCSRKKVERVEFNRHWVRVVLRVLPGGNQQLRFCSSGKEVGFGRYLSDEEQRVLARELKDVTGLSYR